MKMTLAKRQTAARQKARRNSKQKKKKEKAVSANGHSREHAKPLLTRLLYLWP